MRLIGTHARLLAVAAVLVLAGPAAAADPAPAKKEGGPAPVYVKEGGGYRQLTPHEVEEAAEAQRDKAEHAGLKRYDLGIYTLIVFGLLLLILGKFAWPHIAEGLQKREAAIIGAREEAQRDRQAAEQRLAEAKRQVDEAADRARALVEEARRAAEAMQAQAREARDRAAAEQKAQLERDIAAAKDAAMQDLYQQAVDLAALLSAKTVRRQLSPEDHRRLLDEALADLKAGAGRR